MKCFKVKSVSATSGGSATLTGGFDFQYGDSHGCSVVTKCLGAQDRHADRQTDGQITASLNASFVTETTLPN